MKISLSKNDRGEWQADAYLPDGRDFHAIGAEPGYALIGLGQFWLAQPKENDMTTLAKILIGDRGE